MKTRRFVSMVLASASFLSGAVNADILSDENVNRAAKTFPADAMAFAYFDGSSPVLKSPEYEEIKTELSESIDYEHVDQSKVKGLVDSIQSIAVGMGDLSMQLLRFETGFSIKGDFSAEQSETLKEIYLNHFELERVEPIGDVDVYKRQINDTDISGLLNEAVYIYATLPKDGVISVSTDRSYLEYMLKSQNSTNSLLTDAEFQKTVALSSETKVEAISYINTQKFYITMFNFFHWAIKQNPGLTGMAMRPELVTDALRTNYHLDDHGSIISAWNFSKNRGEIVGFCNPNNPDYQQRVFSKPLEIPYIPESADYVTVIAMDNLGKWFMDSVNSINNVLKLFVPPYMGEPIQIAEEKMGVKFAAIAEQLGGQISFAQKFGAAYEGNEEFFVSWGVKDEEAFTSLMKTMSENIIGESTTSNSNGVHRIDDLYWSVKDQKFYFSPDSEFLEKVITKAETNLTESSEFKKRMSDADPKTTQFFYLKDQENGSKFNPDPELGEMLLKLPTEPFEEHSCLQTLKVEDGKYIIKIR